MVIRPLVLLVAVSVGGWFGWQVGQPGGIMGSYLAAVAGASIGLYIGRRIQQALGDD